MNMNADTLTSYILLGKSNKKECQPMLYRCVGDVHRDRVQKKLSQRVLL